VDTSDSRLWRVRGTGGDLAVPAEPVDVGNSGTTLYLAAAAAALARGTVTFTGDQQIRGRSAANLLNSLRDLGCRVEEHGAGGAAPFSVTGPLQGGRTRIECPTSQYLSALLLAAPLAAERVEIDVPLLYERPYVDITLDWLAAEQIRLQRREYEHFAVDGGQSYPPFRRVIPADFSSATFFMVAAAVTGGELLLEGLDPEDSQGDKGAAELLQRMGCTVRWEAEGLRITGPRQRNGGRAPLAAGSFDLNAMPDALPALAAAACYAEGETLLGNVPQARSKETDRIAVMAREIAALGGGCRELPDGLVVYGRGGLRGGEARGHGDHRVIMALAAAGLAAEEPTVIDDTAAAAVTFPEFFTVLAEAGAEIDTPHGRRPAAPGAGGETTAKDGPDGQEQ
jgi:3-phosphoshikimate 1-carboxyvinyltransferase